MILLDEDGVVCWKNQYPISGLLPLKCDIDCCKTLIAEEFFWRLYLTPDINDQKDKGVIRQAQFFIAQHIIKKMLCFITFSTSLS